MFLSIWTDIENWFGEITRDIKDFFVEHSRNPFLWIIIILIGLLIFESVYRALHKD